MEARDFVDPNPAYWAEYSNLQHVKHALVREYLNGWFPKLGFWAGRILYVDTHAGRGRHKTGQPGSPLVALATLMEHKARDRILARSEVVFAFIDRDSENARLLQAELHRSFPDCPARIRANVYAYDCEEVLREAIGYLRQTGQKMAPSFVFVDPYGFKVPMSLLRDLMTFERVELFVNVMWRHLFMGLRRARSQLAWERTMDFIFGESRWQPAATSDDFEAAATETIGLVRSTVGARWVTPIRMLGHNRTTKYMLLHLTNHPEGRDLMKDVRWKVCPSYDGVFVARTAEHPAQLDLGIRPEPDRPALRRWLTSQLGGAPLRWTSLVARVRETDWLTPHVWSEVQDLRSRGRLAAGSHAGRLSQKADPLLSLIPEGPRRPTPKRRASQ
jgi:three-Cys-motif partner protein